MKRICSTVFACLLLSACGFHLKGQWAGDTLPYQAWSVPVNDSMQVPLETALRRQGTGVVFDRNNPQATVRVLENSTDRIASAMSIGGDDVEYLLSLNVSVRLERDGESIGDPIRVRVQRYLEYADDEILGKSGEEDQLWDKIREEAAERVVRQIAHRLAQPSPNAP